MNCVQDGLKLTMVIMNFHNDIAIETNCSMYNSHKSVDFSKKIHKVSANHDCRIEEYAVDSRQILKDQFLWVFFRQ